MNKKILSALFLSLSLVGCGSENKEENADLSANSKVTCHFANTCTQALPVFEKAKGFSSLYNKALSRIGPALHRGRDQIVVKGQPVWIHAKFTYGLADADLKKEKVDVYLSQGCNSPLKKIGETMTSSEGQFPTVEGVEDSGGRVFAKLSDFGIDSLPIGRHRVVLAVQGDNSTTELYINVIQANTPIIVSDIDGTLTESELAAVGDLVNVSAKVNPGAASAINALYQKGYQVIYLTARAEWFASKTRAWLKSNGFPPGTLRTTQSKVGYSGDKAAAYKLAELNQFKVMTGRAPSFGFGNKTSDVKTYLNMAIPLRNSYYFKLEGEADGGIIHDDYTKLAAKFKNYEAVCRK